MSRASPDVPSLHRIVLVMALFSATAGGASTLQNAGSVAAIVGASVAVLLLVAGIVRWWWRHHRIRSVKVSVVTSGEEGLYLMVDGFPASTTEVTALVSDGKTIRRFGPKSLNPSTLDYTFSLAPLLDRTVKKYRVEISTTRMTGEHRRVFKGKVKRSHYEPL